MADRGDRPGPVHLRAATARRSRGVAQATGRQLTGNHGGLSASGRQALEHPSSARTAAVAQAIVQAIGALLPDLEGLRKKAKATPVARRRQLAVGIALFELDDTTLELIAAADRLALGRSQRTELASARAAARVCVRLAGARMRDRTLDPHLPAKRVPVEQQSATR